MTDALVDEAMKKSSLVWLTLDRPRPAWYLWHGGAAYVLTGGSGEQPLPGLPEAGTVEVVVRSKDKGGRLLTWTADVTEITPGTQAWAEITPLLSKERLNSRPQPGEERPEGNAAHDPIPRWAKESWVLKLTPQGGAAVAPGEHSPAYAAVRTVENPAVNTARKPFMIGGRRRKIDR